MSQEHPTAGLLVSVASASAQRLCGKRSSGELGHILIGRPRGAEAGAVIPQHGGEAGAQQEMDFIAPSPPPHLFCLLIDPFSLFYSLQMQEEILQCGEGVADNKVSVF